MKITELKKLIVKEGVHGVYIAGATDACPRFFGDNQGAKPIKIGFTSAYDDLLSKKIDKANALHETKVQFRLWTIGKFWARDLHAIVHDELKEKTRLRYDWFDLGAEKDWIEFAGQCARVANQKHIKVWTDYSLRVFLENLTRHNDLERQLEREIAA